MAGLTTHPTSRSPIEEEAPPREAGGGTREPHRRRCMDAVPCLSILRIDGGGSVKRMASRRARILAGAVATALVGGLAAGYVARHDDSTTATPDVSNVAAPAAATAAAGAPPARAGQSVQPQQGAGSPTKASVAPEKPRPAATKKPGRKPGRGQAIKDAQAAVRRNGRAVRAAKDDRYQP